MELIKITEAITNEGRPFTVTLRGFMGNNNFLADLEGANLIIKSNHHLRSKQEKKLEEKLQELFPVTYNGRFSEEYINKIMTEAPFEFRI
ncbi:hypothetical protein [Clostridium sp.]